MNYLLALILSAFFRTECLSCIYRKALKKNVLLRGKTKRRISTPPVPPISDSINCDYLKGIFNGFSGSIFSVAQIRKEIFLLVETTLYDHLASYIA